MARRASASVVATLVLLIGIACAQDSWTSVRVIQAAPGLANDSVEVENSGNFSVSGLRFLDITAYYNTSSDDDIYKLKVNGKTQSEDSIDAPWSTIAVMGSDGACLSSQLLSPTRNRRVANVFYVSASRLELQAPLLFLHFVDDISGAFLMYSGTATNLNGTVQLDNDLTYMQPSNYTVIPQGQTVFTFTNNGNTLFTEPLYINAGTVYTLYIVPTMQKSPAGQVLMTQDWPPDVP